MQEDFYQSITVWQKCDVRIEHPVILYSCLLLFLLVLLLKNIGIARVGDRDRMHYICKGKEPPEEYILLLLVGTIINYST